MIAPSCLQSLGLLEEYRSDKDDLVADFFIPCLRIAVSYDRAVGYFTSASMHVARKGFEEFIERSGKIRLVASPQLTQEDIDAINRGLNARGDVVERRLLEALAEDPGSGDALQQLAWLVASRALDIRLAVPTKSPGIYHEKVGIFVDADGCAIAFAGSANETVGGLVNNFEAIDVFFSWDESSGRVARKIANFESLWTGQTNSLEVIELPEAVRRELLNVASRASRPSSPDSAPRPGKVQIPGGFVLRDYQEQAIAAWIDHDGRGILAMATGSGKTKTALAAVARLIDRESDTPIVVVTVPYIHLVDQWSDEILSWGLHPIRCYESTKAWEPEVWDALDTLAVVPGRVLCLVATIKTAISAPFRRVLDAVVARPNVLVADEMHHLGSADQSRLLDSRFKWRLGLSATPERWRDEVGTELLESYFGGVVFEFTLGDAIDRGMLSPYFYEPVLVDLDREELDQYRALMERIEQLVADEEPSSSNKLAPLLNERSLILNSAAGKIAAVAADVVGRPLGHTLFYCASRLQMGAVSDLLRDLGHVPRNFTAEEDRSERATVLGQFESGRVPAIVAMRALDEGVDIPDTREAHLLASSGNPREFIQRRGRILRPAPGKTSARLVDYVVVPDADGPYGRELARREMTRVIEFGESSIHPEIPRERVWNVLDHFGLLHLIGGS